MNRLMMAAGAAAVLAASSFAAYAADISGAVVSVDASAGTVTLDDGKTYTLPQGFDLAALKAGEKVKATVDDSDPSKITAISEMAT